MSRLIEHSGVVTRTDGNVVFVTITSQSACGSCSARQACGLAEAQDKIVEVHTHDAAHYASGDIVTVGIRRRAGGIAVLLAYVGALAVLLAVLVVAIKALGLSEGLSAIIALLAVGLYYCAMWLFRAKIENTIHITITKH